jgi:hypothetical protein
MLGTKRSLTMIFTNLQQGTLDDAPTRYGHHPKENYDALTREYDIMKHLDSYKEVKDSDGKPMLAGPDGGRAPITLADYKFLMRAGRFTLSEPSENGSYTVTFDKPVSKGDAEKIATIFSQLIDKKSLGSDIFRVKTDGAIKIEGDDIVVRIGTYSNGGKDDLVPWDERHDWEKLKLYH